MKLPLILAIPSLPVLWLLVQVSDTSAPPQRIPFDNMGQVYLALIMFATTVFTYFSSSRRARQDRAWLIEDRKLKDEKDKEEAKKIRDDLTKEARDIKDEAWRRTDILSDKIDANTKVSTDAFKAANNVNEKIAAVGALRRRDSSETRRESDKAEEK